MAWPPKCLIFWLSSVIGDLVVLKCQLEWAGLNQFELSTLTRGKLLWGRNPLACLHDCAHPKKKIHLQSCCLTGVFGSLLETSNHTKSQEDKKKNTMKHGSHGSHGSIRSTDCGNVPSLLTWATLWQTFKFAFNSRTTSRSFNKLRSGCSHWSSPLKVLSPLHVVAAIDAIAAPQGQITPSTTNL